MNWYAFLEQSNIGCDYTIGCGTKLVKIPAISKEDAIRHILYDYAKDFRSDDREFSIKNITLFGVSDAIDMAKLLLSHNEQIKAEQAIRKEAEEKEKRKAEFEKLKKEFGE